MTEGNVDQARHHAERLLAFERRLGIDIETTLQQMVLDHDDLLTVANWVYIWLHWPLLTVTLVWLLVAHRDRYFELRNAMFVSGAIGLLIYVTLPMAPPRLFSPDFIDTVTLHSHSYRVLQPPGLVNKYAAMPSLHVGWNLLAGIAWWHAGRLEREAPHVVDRCDRDAHRHGVGDHRDGQSLGARRHRRISDRADRRRRCPAHHATPDRAGRSPRGR